MNIAPEQIRDYAVKAVEGFINNQVPLSTSISTMAVDMELNPEQIKRLVEATNTICQLKLISMAEDRTFEFPVAKYEEVLKEMTVPEHLKEAQINTAGSELLPGGGSYLITRRVANTLPAEPKGEHVETPLVNINPELSQIGRMRLESVQIPSPVQSTHGGGSLDTTTDGLGITEHEKAAYLMKQYIANKGELEKIAMAKEEMFARISDTAYALRKDPEALEKLSTVTDGDTFMKMAKLIGKDPSEVKSGLIFKDKELEKAASICGLYKEAQNLISEESERLKLEKRAVALLGRLATAPARGAGKAVGAVAGTAVGATAATVAKGIVPAAKKIGLKGAISHTMNIGGALSYEPKVDVWQALHS